MRIGVVSDTHGHLGYAQAAIRELSRLDVSVVLHCGDIGSPAIIPLFAPWPTHFVFGNVDAAQPLRAAIRDAGQTCHDRFGALELDGVKIALLHSDDAARFTSVVASGEWGLVCYGHTHVPEQHFVGPTLVLNPGALYRADPHTIATVDLATMVATHITVPGFSDH